jgi:phytanoyl-CoA hydroxylase
MSLNLDRLRRLLMLIVQVNQSLAGTVSPRNASARLNRFPATGPLHPASEFCKARGRMSVTTAGAAFTADEVALFDRQGFLVVRQMVSAELVAQLRSLVEDQLQRHVPPVEYEADLHYPGAPTSRQVPGGQTVRRLKQAHSRSYLFTEWLQSPPLLNRLQQLLGPAVVCPLAHHNCIMTKHPAFSSETGWHQDLRYWSFQRPELVNAWLALGSERAANGGLRVIPGSHRARFADEQFDHQRFFRTDWPANEPWLNRQQLVELDAGDVLFFHCLTLHAADRNTTNQTKLSVVFTFRPGDNPPIPGTRSAESPELILTPGVPLTRPVTATIPPPHR